MSRGQPETLDDAMMIIMALQAKIDQLTMQITQMDRDRSRELDEENKQLIEEQKEMDKITVQVMQLADRNDQLTAEIRRLKDAKV